MNRLARRWPIGHLLFTTHLPFLLLCWAAMMVLAGLVLTGVAIFGTVRISAIDVGGQILRWLALGYGGYLTYNLLPVYLVHGQTRREFLRQAPVFQFVTSAAVAALTTLGYAAESLLYRANGWTQAFTEDRPYTAASQYGVIFLSYWSMLLVWSLTGLFIGAGFYRLQAGGVLTLLLALPLLAVSGLSTGFLNLPFLDLGLGLRNPGLPAVVGLSALCAVVALGLAWALARDMPLRTRTS
ncbi:MAG TPA: hypothetical protein VF755_23805 [Catenuloplanes sp.]|jgi:hypothetical protein